MTPQALRVLVVDDDESVCAALGAVLSSEQHTVALSMSAREALQLVAQLQPDIAILDVNMPGLDGADLCGLLRALARFARDSAYRPGPGHARPQGA